MLVLSLLNLRVLGSLNNLRAVDPATDVMTEAEAKAQDKARESAGSISNLRQIGIGLRQYAQDYDEKLPPMRSVQSQSRITGSSGRLTTVQDALFPYIKNVHVYSHPVTHQLYQPNQALSGRLLSQIKQPRQTLAFWEKSPSPDGFRAVLYLDGHVVRERESNWPRIKALSDHLVPPPPNRPRRAMVPDKKRVRLTGAAELYYRYRTGSLAGRRTQIYVSHANGRIYYRDPKTHQAIWMAPSPAGITVPAASASIARNYQGYAQRKTGLIFGGYGDSSRPRP